MTILKPEPAHAGNLAAGAWAAVALTPFGWFFGVLAVAYSHLGDAVDVSQLIAGHLIFVTAPTGAFVLAVCAARAGHRSGKIAVVVSGLLLLATIAATLLYGEWIGLAVAAAVAVLVLAWVRSGRIAVVVTGLLLLATLLFSAWETGGWINLAVIAVMAVVAMLVFAWARSRSKPPPRPDGAQHQEGRRRIPRRQAHPDGLREFTQPGPVKPHPARASRYGPVPLLFEDDRQACQ